jgi:integrase
MGYGQGKHRTRHEWNHDLVVTVLAGLALRAVRLGRRRARRWSAGPAGLRLPGGGDRGYVALLRLYLARAGYTAGPLFRASINGSGGPLSYDAAHHRWEGYCRAAGIGIGIHQLRHAHATELVNSGVSIEAVRRRLGHASTETTQLSARAARRQGRRHRDPRRAPPTGPVSSLTGLALSRLNAIACTW